MLTILESVGGEIGLRLALTMWTTGIVRLYPMWHPVEAIRFSLRLNSATAVAHASDTGMIVRLGFSAGSNRNFDPSQMNESVKQITRSMHYDEIEKSTTRVLRNNYSCLTPFCASSCPSSWISKVANALVRRRACSFGDLKTVDNSNFFSHSNLNSSAFCG